jgi:hypothetical protein
MTQIVLRRGLSSVIACSDEMRWEQGDTSVCVRSLHISQVLT